MSRRMCKCWRRSRLSRSSQQSLLGSYRRLRAPSRVIKDGFARPGAHDKEKPASIGGLSHAHPGRVAEQRCAV